MFYKVKKHTVGLDHSGPCKVLPPTFGGVRQLVERVGEEVAKAQFVTPPDVDDASTDLVRDFLQDLTYSDKVERQTLINDFNSYIKDLQNSIGKSSPRSAKAPQAAAGAPDSGANPAAATSGAPTASEDGEPQEA